MSGRKFVMAKDGWHKALGEFHDPEYDLAIVFEENSTHFIGMWVYGMALINMQFSKETTRELTPEERQNLRGKKVGTTYAGPFELDIDDERQLVKVPDKEIVNA